MDVGGQHSVRATTPIVGFSRESMRSEGKVTLLVTIQDKKGITITSPQEFYTIDAPTKYNCILGKKFLGDITGIPSSFHQTLLFIGENEKVGRARGCQQMSKTYNMIKAVRTHKKKSRQEEERKEEKNKRVCTEEAARDLGTVLTLRKRGAAEEDPKPYFDDEAGNKIPPKTLEPEETELEEIPLIEGTDKMIKVGKTLSPVIKAELAQLMKKNTNLFAWYAADMPGIDPATITHKLNVIEGSKPVKQKKRSMALEKEKAAEEEVKKLLEAGFIEPCQYPEWLANVVLVSKATEGWRMCIHFTNLNKACPKDFYPLPRIDQLVDSIAGHALLCCMDAFSRYHQIFMDPADKEKAALICPTGVYNYN